ncbi:MAG: molybdopterin-dependent oxidoreductase [Gammaproteobacteria bacterium]|nr:molybdopterin-dependent oxidoreductase [Gammaproteobacteria bacterium]
MQRREFLKLSGTMLATAAAGPTLLSGCSQKRLPGSGQVTTSPTICNICFWKCAGVVYQEDGKPWKIVGNQQDLHSGGRLCTRGTGGIGAYQDADRLQTPMLRVSNKDGQYFRKASWDEALDYIAQRMRSIEQKHGNDRLALLSHGSGGDFFQTLLQGFGSYIYGHPSYAQCRGPREVGFALTYGEEVGSIDRTDMENSRCIVLIGSHIGENLHNGQVQTLSEAINKDATLITVDPRFSVAASKSKHWLPIKPGTDMALLLAWINVLINEGLYDRDYVARYTQGLEALTEHVQPFNPEWAYLETGLDPELIRTTAREMARNAPATLVHPGRHVTWYGDDTQRSRAIAILNALLGSWGCEGGFYIPEKVKLPEYPIPKPPPAKSDWKKIIQPEFPLSPSGISQSILAACSGDNAHIKGLFVYATNLPHTIPNSIDMIKQAAQDLDLMVVIDTMPAEITGYADVILPECTYLERYDEIRNVAERQPSLALRMPAFEPRYQSKPAWWIAQQLAKRLELEQYFPYQDYAEVIDWQLRQVDSSLTEMKTLGVKNFERKTAMYFREGEQIRFRTPSGKIELYSKTLEDNGYDPLPKYTPPQQPPNKFYHLNYGRAPAHTFGRTSNNPLLFELMPENAVWINPLVAKDWQINNGEYLRLQNPEGTLSNRVRVRITERIRPDSVFIVHGFGHTSKSLRLANGVGASDALLMSRVLVDPIMGGTGMRGNFVTFVRES